MRLHTPLVLLFLLWVSPAVTAASSARPAETVEAFNAALIDVMQHADELGFAGRFQKLEPVIRDSFDFNTILRIITGRHWRKLSAQQKTELLETFIELSVCTYAFQFDGYAGESFETVSEKVLSAGRASVRVLLHKANGKTTRFDYQLNQTDEQWHIVNITVDGVSDLALKRAEYNKVLSGAGFEALLDSLRKKIANYRQGDAHHAG